MIVNGYKQKIRPSEKQLLFLCSYYYDAHDWVRIPTKTQMRVFTAARLLITGCAVRLPGKRKQDEKFLYGIVFSMTFC